MSENNSCVHIRFEELFNIPAVDTIHASIICVLTGAPRSGFRSAGGCPTLSRLSLSTHPHTAMPAYIVAFKTGDEVEASAVDDACAKVESSGGQSVPVSHTPHIRRMTHARPNSTRLTQADAASFPATSSGWNRIKHKYNSRVMTGFAGTFSDDVKADLEKVRNRGSPCSY